MLFALLGMLWRMGSVRRAVIDIGTNSVKLLVADVDDGSILPVHETSKQTRLGRGLYEDNLLHPDSIAETEAAVAAFTAEARRLEARSIRVIATSAMREAANSKDLRDAVLRSCGLPTEIITGDEEAELAFRGAATDSSLADQNMLLLDMGGGSTEMILGCHGQVRFRHSFPLGTLRLMAQVSVPENPAPEHLAACRQFLRNYMDSDVRPLVQPALENNAEFCSGKPILLVGTGGTATILGRLEKKLNSYERSVIESVHISLKQMSWHTERLWSLPLNERRQLPGLPQNRADIILPGAATYEAIMQAFGLNELRVSTRGLRFAALLSEADPS